MKRVHFQIYMCVCVQYYRHERSKGMFRSTIEVVNFLLYEAYPDKLKPENDEKFEEDQESLAVSDI